MERLEAHGELADIRDRLAAFLVNLAEETEPLLTTGEQTETLRQLDFELDSLRAALSWLRVRGDVQQLGRLAAALAVYCTHRGLLTEGRRWIADARGLGSGADPLLAANLLSADGMLAGELGQPAEAVSLLRQAAEIYRARGDGRNLGRVLAGLANAELSRGELEAATEAGVEARRLARTHRDLRAEASAVGNLGLVALLAGRFADAEAKIAEAVELFRKTGDRSAVVLGLGNLGEVARKRGDTEAAGRRYQDALDAARELGEIGLEGWVLANLAVWHVEEGDLDVAAEELATGLSKLAAAEDTERGAGAIDTAALVLARRSRFADAALAWGAYEAAIARMGVRRDPQSMTEAAVAATRDALGEPEFERFHAAGAALSIADAIKVVVDRLSDPVTTSHGHDN